MDPSHYEGGDDRDLGPMYDIFEFGSLQLTVTEAPVETAQA
jgi:hypothetical protein